MTVEQLLARDSLRRINRRIAVGFGLLILLLLATVLMVSGYYFHRLLDQEQNRLQGIVAELVHEAITRVSFSGKYQARLLVEEIVAKRPSVAYVILTDSNGRVLAHSDPRFDDTVDRSSEMERALDVLRGVPQVVQDLDVNGQEVHEVALPFRAGFGGRVVGVVRVAVSREESKRAFLYAILYLIGLAALLLVVSFFAVLRLAEHFGRPVVRLAAFFGGILDYAPLLISVRDREGRLLETSAAFNDAFPESRVGQSWYDVLFPGQAERIRSSDRDVFETGLSSRTDEFFVVGESTRFYTATRFPVALAAEGQVELICGVALDITERKHAEEQLFQEKEIAQVTLKSIADAVITTDHQGNVRYLNPVAERMTGWMLGDAFSRPLEELFRLEDETSGMVLEDPVRKVLRGRKATSPGNHTVLLSRQGGRLPIETSAAPILDQRDNILGVVLVFHDVSVARELRRKMEFQATHDALTGLVNRSHFEVCLQELLDAGGMESHALCYMDLDQFKVVNDTCGHAAGDELLRQLAAMLQYSVAHPDIIARLGGDEFGVLLRNVDSPRGIARAQALLDVVANFRFYWQETPFVIGASIGLVFLRPGEIANRHEALIAADTACYTAKEAGRNRLEVHRPGDMELARRHGEMRWVNRINQGLDDGRFRLYFQRIVPLGGAGREHWEILLRMLDTDGTPISPALFIPAAERYDLMPRLDRWVVAEALAAHAAHKEVSFSINLSAASLADENFRAFVAEAMKASGADPRSITFEITETAAIRNLARAAHFIASMKELGCSFALDDFGSGMASFSYLKNLPVDYLKIDGSFIRGALSDPMDRVLVDSANRIGAVLGVKTVAECVENKEIVDYLRELGVNYAQGYHFHYPEPLVV